MTVASTLAALARAGAFTIVLAGAGGALAQTAATPPAAASAPSGPVLRPEVANAVNAAQEAGRAGQKDAAEAKLSEAAAVPSLNPYEQAVIERGRGAVALSLKDWDGAIRALDAAVAANQLAPADQLPLVELLAKLNYQQKQYPAAVNWIRRYKQSGGTDAGVVELLPQALYLTNDFAGAAAELEPRVAADEAAGKAVPESTLRLLASSYIQGKDDAGYLRTLERMALAYPKPEYWGELSARATKQPGFSERLWLDVYRLRFAAGLLKQTDEFVDMANLSLQAGYPAEALRVIDKGYALSLLGNGKDAAAHTQLRQRADKAAEKDSADMARSEGSAKAAREGDALVNLGFAMVSAGQAGRGLPLMEAGLAKGNLRRADEARLHHGIALWTAGKRDEAAKAFAEVKGGDGSAALARVWSLFVRSPAGARS
ncbi:MAG: hypothetical protein U1E89_09370 [Burkholderiaceae bacterium]